jgi:hypothetical protein
MAVVNNYENVVARSSSGEIRNAPTYKRTFTVRCDNPDTSMVDIANAPGITYGAPHPHDASCFVTNVDVDADGDSMLIYTVSYSYTRPVGDLSVTGGTPIDPSGGGGGGGGNTPPDPLKIPEGYWSGGSALEVRQSPITRSFVAAALPVAGKLIRMTNGRPFTNGVALDFASEQLNLTNYYSDWEDVKRIAERVDVRNLLTWPKNAAANLYGPLAWKIVGFNWSFKQQSSGQQRLEYYEVQVTFKRDILWRYIDGTHILQGFPAAVEADIKANKVGIPSSIPMIASAGFQEKDKNNELSAIPVNIKYFDCDGKPVDPSKIPTDPGQDPDGPCAAYPRKEPTTEEMPLDKDGKACPPNTAGAIIVPWTEEYPLSDFNIIFGDGPPFKPKATTT